MGNISTPKIRFPDFKGEWINNSLGEIAKFSKGKGISKEDISETGETECIRYGELYTTYNETIDTVFSKTNIDTSHLVLSEANDVIIPASGETEVDIAKASCILKSGIALGGDLNIIKTLNNGVFLSYYLNSKKKIDIAKLAQGISVVHLYAGQLSKLQLKIPSLPEQQKIASFFTAIDHKISQLKRKKTLLEQYKKGVMQKIFSQEIRFKDDNEHGFPKWEKKKLGDVFTEINESVGERDIPTYSITAGIGFVSQKEKFGRNISGQQNKNYTVIDEGQFSYNKGNSKTYKYGCVYLNDTGEKIAVPNVFISFERVDPKMSTKYYSKLFESHYLDKELRKIISSSARMDGLLNVNKNSFFKLKVPCPNHYEQHKIGDFLCSLDNKIQNTQKQIEQAEQGMKGLMQQMFV